VANGVLAEAKAEGGVIAPRLLGGYNVRSVRIPGVVKKLAASDIE
jgi:hypothetical protein